MAIQFREGGDRLWSRAPLPHDQLIFSYVERLLFTNIFEVKRPHDGHRVFAFIGPVEIGGQKGSFD
jgi:hypothetical protein